MIDSENVTLKNKAFILANLMRNRFAILENTRVQFTYKVIKILCLSVLNDENTVIHHICKYKYFHPRLIHCAILFSIKTTKIENKND